MRGHFPQFCSEIGYQETPPPELKNDSGAVHAAAPADGTIRNNKMKDDQVYTWEVCS